MKLSILICTVFGREPSFNRLISELEKQKIEGVEILSEKDNKQISVGKKRQNLVDKAKGEYVVFIDDDDMPGPTYVRDIMKALEQNPDCVGFLQRCTFNGSSPKTVCLSLKYKDWADNVDGFHAVRSPYHKTPILKSKVLEAGGFKDMRFAEDHDFSKRVTPLLKKEVFIKKELYYYNYKSEPFNQKYGIKG